MGLRRSLVLFKYTLMRGYQWCQLPTLAIIGAGIIKPYVPWLRYYQIALLAFGTFIFVGLMDRWLGLLNSELSYATEMNPVMMKGLYKEEQK